MEPERGCRAAQHALGRVFRHIKLCIKRKFTPGKVQLVIAFAHGLGQYRLHMQRLGIYIAFFHLRQHLGLSMGIKRTFILAQRHTADKHLALGHILARHHAGIAVHQLQPPYDAVALCHYVGDLRADGLRHLLPLCFFHHQTALHKIQRDPAVFFRPHKQFARRAHQLLIVLKRTFIDSLFKQLRAGGCFLLRRKIVKADVPDKVAAHAQQQDAQHKARQYPPTVTVCEQREVCAVFLPHAQAAPVPARIFVHALVIPQRHCGQIARLCGADMFDRDARVHAVV